MSRARTWIKMSIIGLGLCIGGPALVMYVSPTEEELFQRFNPDLQKRNLEMREIRLQRYHEFVTKLKEYSKSDKPIWQVAAEAAAQASEDARRAAAEEESQKVTASAQAPETATQKVEAAQRAAVDEKVKVVDQSPAPQEQMKPPTSVVR